MGNADSKIFNDCCDCNGFGIYNSLSLDAVENALEDLASRERIIAYMSKRGTVFYEVNENYDPAYAMFNNKTNAKKFSEDYFLYRLNQWNTPIPFPIAYPKRIKLKDAFVVTADGTYEAKLIKQLDNKDLYLHIRCNNFSISKNKSKTKHYYPDIIFYTKDGYIGIIEVKPMFDMCDNKVRRKYDLLANFCEQKGFLYTMCDFQYHTYDFMMTREVNEYLESLVEETIDDFGAFTQKDFEEFASGKDSKTKKKYRNQLAALAIQKNYSVTIHSQKKKYNFVIRKKKK